MENDDANQELTLSDYLEIINKNKKFIILFVLVCTLATAVVSVLTPNTYETEAVIMPVDAQDKMGGLASMASQFSGLAGIAGMAGISLPGATSSYELEGLLNSNVVRERVIVHNNLLPILFYKQWDDKKGEWGELPFPWKTISKVRAWMRSMVPSSEKHPIVYSDFPTVGDGLEAFEKKIIDVKRDRKSEMITITAKFHDPVEVAQIVNCFLETLNDHMRSEAKRVASTNRVYLEEQLNKAVDPVVRQKIYSLLSKQVETALMAEVKENFAFKVIDPPMVPNKKKGPNRALRVIAGFLGSTFLGIMIAVYRENKKKGSS